MQLINILDDQTEKAGWRNHPACKMWVGHTDALKHYCNVMIREWINRGYKNTMQFYNVDITTITYPKWLGDGAFHASHRAALLYKNYDFYSQFGWSEQPELNYIWPTP